MMQYSTFLNLKKIASAKYLSGNFLSGKNLAGKGLLWLLKLVVLLLMIYFINIKVSQGQLSFGEIGSFSRQLYNNHSWWLLGGPVFLVVFNWGLEAKKWQLLASPVVSLSQGQAVRAVLTGLGLGFVTPRSVGDYAGRILEAPGRDRSRLVGAVIMNRVSQSFSTYFMGVSGLLYLFATSGLAEKKQWVWLLPVLLSGMLLSLFLLDRGRYRLLAVLKHFKGYSVLKAIRVMGQYSRKEMLLLLMYSFLRYLVFSIQFVWVLKLAGIHLPFFALYAGVSVVFMLKSVIPAFNFLSDLGVRELSALWVFSVFSVPESQLILASLLVWCMNILLPALAGGVNILRLRINRNPC